MIPGIATPRTDGFTRRLHVLRPRAAAGCDPRAPSFKTTHRIVRSTGDWLISIDNSPVASSTGCLTLPWPRSGRHYNSPQTTSAYLTQVSEDLDRIGLLQWGISVNMNSMESQSTLATVVPWILGGGPALIIRSTALGSNKELNRLTNHLCTIPGISGLFRHFPRRF